MSPAGKALLTVAIVTVGTAIGAAVVGKRKGAPGPKPGDDEDGGQDAPGAGGMFQNHEKPIAVGEAGDPIIAPLVAEIQQNWDAAGIPRSLMTPQQFYVMTKAPHVDGPDPDHEKGPILAIAPRATWERTMEFLHDVVMPIFADIEAHHGSRSLYRVGGYRPADYNDAVGGADASRHVDGDALDIIPIKAVPTNNDLLLMAIARFVVKHPDAPIGFGAYAGNGHVDIGGRRHWDGKTVKGKAQKYLDRAKAEENIA
jgi:Peptidase M15